MSLDEIIRTIDAIKLLEHEIKVTTGDKTDLNKYLEKNKNRYKELTGEDYVSKLEKGIN